MQTLQELLAQKSAIERQITEARSSSRASAVADIKALMDTNGLTLADLTSALASSAGKSDRVKKKVAAKYRDPTSGQTWTGRGLKPKWLTQALETGKTLADFVL